MNDRRDKQKIINLEVYTDGSLKQYLHKMTFGGESLMVYWEKLIGIHIWRFRRIQE